MATTLGAQETTSHEKLLDMLLRKLNVLNSELSTSMDSIEGALDRLIPREPTPENNLTKEIDLSSQGMLSDIFIAVERLQYLAYRNENLSYKLNDIV